MKQTDTQMFIGKLAHKTGLSVQAVRYYESEGLLKPPRSTTKYRIYNESHVRRLQFIQLLEAVGFSLREVRQVLESLDSKSGAAHTTLVVQMATAKLTELEHRLKRLRELLQSLWQWVVAEAENERRTSDALVDHVLSRANPEKPPAQEGPGTDE